MSAETLSLTSQPTALEEEEVIELRNDVLVLFVGNRGLQGLDLSLNAEKATKKKEVRFSRFQRLLRAKKTHIVVRSLGEGRRGTKRKP